jgi:Fic family protein
MERRETGMYIPVSTVGETVRAFVPGPLPPQPPLELNKALQEAGNRAYLTLGRLDSAAAFLPDTSVFLYQYIRKEAVLSSQIEGTQSSLSDLMLFEIDGAPGVPLDDVREMTGRKRDRVYLYDRCIQIVSQETPDETSRP